MRFTHYETGGFYDEMFDPDGEPRSGASTLSQFIDTLPDGELLRRQQSAERALLHMGITSASTATTPERSGSSRSISCRGLSPRPNGTSSSAA